MTYYTASAAGRTQCFKNYRAAKAFVVRMCKRHNATEGIVYRKCPFNFREVLID